NPSVGVVAAPSKNTLSGALGSDNVKITSSQTVSAATSVNALLIKGSGITVSGAGSLVVGSGLVADAGLGNAVNVPVSFGRATGLIGPANPAGGGSTLDLGGAIDGTLGIAKLGTGRATFAGSNTYLGVTNVYEGTLRIANSSALGVGQNSAT